MLIQVYRYVGDLTRSITRATLVAEIETDEFPKNQREFAIENGGDFLEVAHDLVGV